MTLETRVFGQFDDLAPLIGSRPAVALSGGGDSIALMHLLARWSKGRAVSPYTATVDHSLRAESAAEVAFAEAAATGVGLPHQTLNWTGWDGTGNLQDSARIARRSLIESWARDSRITSILSGHTADDQSETVLMRLARGSGVDGLAGMRMNVVHGLRWLRPLLGVTRCELREYLLANDASWIEDPSNDDARFDRVKARKLLTTLSDLGLTSGRLQETARHMQAAKVVLDAAMFDLAERIVVQDEGDLLVDCAGFGAAAAETRCRLLARALMWISGRDHRPRFGPLRDLAGSRSGTLHGCALIDGDPMFRIVREYQAVRHHSRGTGDVWDGRWRLDGPHAAALVLRALGPEGLPQVPDWRASGRPRAALMATPAVWRGDTLVAAPLAGMRSGWRASLKCRRDDFLGSLMSH